MAARGAMTHDHLTMDTTDAEMTSKPTPAPRVRQTLAGLIDAGVIALPTVVYGLRTWRARGTERPAASPPDWMRLLAPAFAVLGEQVGTPEDGSPGSGRSTGGRAGGLRCGARSRWHWAQQLATRVLSRRPTPRPALASEDERRRRARDVQAIKERYADDEDARNAELMRHYAEHRVNVTASFWPPLIAGLGSTLVAADCPPPARPDARGLARPG